MSQAVVLIAEPGFAECPHSQRAVRYRQFANGARQWVRQCVTCGHATNAIAFSKLSPAEVSEALPFDDDLARRYYEAELARRTELRESRQAEDRQAWFEEHEEYLQSAE